jgi:cobyrinic acid a,c-diamide synthase
MFEQAGIAVTDERGYAQLHALIDAAFDSRDVEVFLDRVIKSKLRVRDYEGVLKRGLLGKAAVALYGALPVSDQGLTRERYLRLVEAVPLELRQRYFRIYAYY